MKMNRNFKKALSVLLCILIAFSTVSFAVGAAPRAERVSEIEMYGSDGHAHVYGNWEILSAATCTREGEKKRYCAVEGCTAFYTKSIAVVENAHVYDTWTTTVEATCEKVGTKVAVCTEKDCGHVETRSIIKLQHTITEMYLPDGSLSPDWTVTVEPVHSSLKVTQVGYARSSCDVCGTTVTMDYYGEKDANGEYKNWHKLSGKVTTISAPTCSTPGVGMDKCTICGDTVSIDLETEENAHVFAGRPIVTEPSTCMTKGSGTNKCTECGKVVAVEIEEDMDVHVDANGNVLEWVLTKTPNFHIDGTESLTCANPRCGTLSRTVYADHGLTDKDFRVVANPNCVKPGLMIAECSNCRKTIEKEIPVDNSHSWGEAEVLSVATCAQEGMQVRHCNRDYSHVLYEVTEKTAHTFSTPWEVEIVADCNNEGREINECVECAQKVTRVIPIDSDAHDFVDDNGVVHDWQELNPASCTKVGEEINYCYECKKTVSREIPKHPGTLVKVSEKAASCKYEGEIFYECSKCAADVLVAIPVDAEAHNYIGEPAVYIAPTCQKEGVGLTVCSYCNKECKTILPADPDAHCDKEGNLLDWEVLKAVSGCKNGTEKMDCYYCGTKTRTLYSTHGMGENMFNIYAVASCEKDGALRSKYKCPDCYEYVIVPYAAGHKGALSKIVRAATCTEDGLALYICDRGDHLFYEIIPATGHVASDEYKILIEADCNTKGEKQLYCAVCKEDIQPPEEIPNEHIYTPWIIDIGEEATCGQSGYRYRGCQREGCTFYEKVPYGVAHTSSDWVYPKDYNCKTGGELYRFCTTCEKILGTKKVAAGNHGSTRTESVAATGSYCVGTKVICNLCDEVVSETKTAHKSYVIKGMEGWDATCTTDGKTDGTYCMVCGYQTTQTIIPAFGHTWDWNENGNEVCKTCGDYKVGNQDPENNENYDGGCKCFCHDKGTIAKILYKVCIFFWKLLKINQKCDCGTVHWTTE